MVKSDSGYYVEVEQVVDLELLNQNPNFRRNPVVIIRLHPSSSYPFPEGTTLIRGTVQTQSTQSNIFGTEKIPVANATIKITKLNLASSTDKNGEYFFYFTKLRTDNIVEELSSGNVKKMFIKTNDNTSLFTLRVEHTAYKLFQKEKQKAEVGFATVINADLKPK